MCVLGDSDDLEVSSILGIEDAKVLSDRALMREEFFGERLVHHSDGSRRRSIPLRDRTALQDFRPHYIEIIVSHANPRGRILPAIGRWRSLARDVDRLLVVVALHRAVERKADLLDARNSQQRFAKLAIQR